MNIGMPKVSCNDFQSRTIYAAKTIIKHPELRDSRYMTPICVLYFTPVASMPVNYQWFFSGKNLTKISNAFYLTTNYCQNQGLNLVKENP